MCEDFPCCGHDAGFCNAPPVDPREVAAVIAEEMFGDMEEDWVPCNCEDCEDDVMVGPGSGR